MFLAALQEAHDIVEPILLSENETAGGGDMPGSAPLRQHVETKNDADCACNKVKVTKSNPLYEEEHDPHRKDCGKAANTSELAHVVGHILSIRYHHDHRGVHCIEEVKSHAHEYARKNESGKGMRDPCC